MAEDKCRCGAKRMGSVQSFAAYECGSYDGCETDLCVRRQRDALQAVVDKLPKTADGVMVTGPMPLWVVQGARIEDVDGIGWRARGDKGWMAFQERRCNDEDWIYWIPLSRCYSTREAAEGEQP